MGICNSLKNTDYWPRKYHTIELPIESLMVGDGKIGPSLRFSILLIAQPLRSGISYQCYRAIPLIIKIELT